MKAIITQGTTLKGKPVQPSDKPVEMDEDEFRLLNSQGQAKAYIEPAKEPEASKKEDDGKKKQK